MKKISFVFFISVLFLGLLVSTQAVSQELNGPELKWETPRYDYGTVYVDDLPDTKLDIKFTNAGDAPLVLSNVRACCGTRVLDWPKEPIMPDQEAEITIQFRLAPRAQNISRTVTVTSNANQTTSIFRIVGTIVER